MEQNPQHSSWSLTWREIVVLVVVPLLIVAILSPLIGVSRAVAERDACKNRLSRVGVALHNYHETFDAFPPGWVATGPGLNGQPEESAYSWLLASLPFFESSPLYQTIKRDDPFQDEVQRVRMPIGKNGARWSAKPLGARSLPSFRCPADNGGFNIDTTSSVPLMATSNYVGNFGVGIPRYGRHYGVLMQGIFGENSHVRIRDIRDGTSNTILVGERRLPYAEIGRNWREGDLEGSLASYWAGFPRGTSPLAIVATGTDGELPDRDAAPDTINVASDGELNLNGHLKGLPRLRISRVNSLLDGDRLRSTKNGNSINVSIGFSGHHGGTNLLMGDGSVRKVASSLDGETLLQLFRRSDGTLFEDGSF